MSIPLIKLWLVEMGLPLILKQLVQNVIVGYKLHNVEIFNNNWHLIRKLNHIFAMQQLTRTLNYKMQGT